MNAQQWRHVTEAITKALQLPLHEREGWVRAECGDNSMLAEQVLSLLHHNQKAESEGFLGAPANEVWPVP